MKYTLLKTPFCLFASFLIFFSIVNTAPLQAQNGCELIQFNVQPIGPCHYRLVTTNSSTCYPFIRLLFFDAGSFENWNVASGWTAEEISPTEILLTHSSGHIPTGASTPFDFYLPSGVSPVLDIQWDDSCPPGKGCFTQIQMDACFIPSDACISGVNYVDVGCTQEPYSSQPKLSGRPVMLLDAFGNTLQTTTTSVAGAYSFCSLPPGNYIVRITNPTDWTASVPASGQYAVVLEASQTLVRNFGSCRANCLCSSVQTSISPVSSGPNQCCYSLSTQLGGGGSYCFNYIDVQVDAGLSIVPGATQTGWTMTANGIQSVIVTPPSGYIPSNTAIAGNFCVTGPSPQSILTIVSHNSTIGLHECITAHTGYCNSVDPCPTGNPRIAVSPGPEHSFSGEADLNPGVTVVSAVWDFGDGTRDSSCCLSPVAHSFEPGTYTTCLTITTANEEGETCTDSSCVEVLVNCCSDDAAAFTQTVHNAVQVVTDAANCKATIQVGNLPCQRIDWIDWGDQSQSIGPFLSGAMPMHAYAYGVFYSITYQVSEINPITGAVCYQQVFTEGIILDCDCSCGLYDLSIRFGGAQNQPVSCGQTIPVSVQQSIYLYSNFQCQGTHCAPSTLVNWALTGPGNTSISSSDLAIPAFSVSALTPGNFSTPGLYTLNMYAICGLQDTCRCVLYFDVIGCCGGPNDPDSLSTEVISVTPSDEPCAANFDIGALPDCYFVDSIRWGDGTVSVGPFSADTSIVHVYGSEDTYAVTFDLVQQVAGAAEPCFRKSYTSAVNPVCLIACPCLGFSNLVLTPGPSGPPLNVTCGTDIVLPCQPGAYMLSGNLPCACLGWNAVINWQLFGPQGLVDAGNTFGTPAFSIPLPSGYFYVPGTYSLILDGYCTNHCTCVIYFVITQPCPPLCPCDVVDFMADVAAGFSYSSQPFLSCNLCFKGVKLGVCDMVEWKIDNNPWSSPIAGNQSYCFVFSGNATHTIEMRVTRKKGVNSVCEVFTFQKTITVNCLPIIVFNPLPIPTTPRQNQPGTGTPPRPLAAEASAERRYEACPSPVAIDIRVVPNPNNGSFRMDMSEPAPASARYCILSLTGQELRSEDILEGALQQNIEAGDLPGGLYFLQLLIQGKVMTVEKLIKQ